MPNCHQVCLTELVHAINLDMLGGFDAKVSASVQNTLQNGKISCFKLDSA